MNPPETDRQTPTDERKIHVCVCVLCDGSIYEQLAGGVVAGAGAAGPAALGTGLLQPHAGGWVGRPAPPIITVRQSIGGMAYDAHALSVGRSHVCAVLRSTRMPSSSWDDGQKHTAQGGPCPVGWPRCLRAAGAAGHRRRLRRSRSVRTTLLQCSFCPSLCMTRHTCAVPNPDFSVLVLLVFWPGRRPWGAARATAPTRSSSTSSAAGSWRRQPSESSRPSRLAQLIPTDDTPCMRQTNNQTIEDGHARLPLPPSALSPRHPSVHRSINLPRKGSPACSRRQAAGPWRAKRWTCCRTCV